jgi:hypothetical protein
VRGWGAFVPLGLKAEVHRRLLCAASALDNWSNAQSRCTADSTLSEPLSTSPTNRKPWSSVMEPDAKAWATSRPSTSKEGGFPPSFSNACCLRLSLETISFRRASWRAPDRAILAMPYPTAPATTADPTSHPTGVVATNTPPNAEPRVVEPRMVEAPAKLATVPAAAAPAAAPPAVRGPQPICPPYLDPPVCRSLSRFFRALPWCQPAARLQADSVLRRWRTSQKKLLHSAHPWQRQFLPTGGLSCAECACRLQFAEQTL